MNNDDNRFTTTLLQWFEENARPLPWRGIGNAYAVWLSEVILQQTRIEQGTDYWFRFMERFPTVEHLAEATEDEVLRLWQGLAITAEPDICMWLPNRWCSWVDFQRRPVK